MMPGLRRLVQHNAIVDTALHRIYFGTLRTIVAAGSLHRSPRPTIHFRHCHFSATR